MWRIVIIATAVLSCAAKDKITRAPVDPAFEPFNEAVKQYVDLRRGQEKKFPKLPDRAEPEQIAAHKANLRSAIRQARAGARQGDIFLPAVRACFVDTVRSEMRGAAGVSAKRTVMKENPKAPGVPGDVKLAVNAPYPPEAPVTTLPPSLLLRLPTLPEPLEYRFVGRALILRDAYASMVVDYLPNAMPAGGGL